MIDGKQIAGYLSKLFEERFSGGGLFAFVFC